MAFYDVESHLFFINTCVLVKFYLHLRCKQNFTFYGLYHGFYLDFAYQNRSYGEQFYPYYNWVKLDGEVLPYNNASYLKTTQNNFAMTLGMRF